MEKKHIIILSFLLLITIAVASIAVVSISVISTPEKKLVLDLSKLELNQDDAYVAISSNDSGGSNRWLPFYFTIESEKNTNFKSILAILNKAERENIVRTMLHEDITRVTLYSETNESLISTDKVIWTATEYNNGSSYEYQILLIIDLDLDELKLDKATNIQKMTFDMSNGEKIEHVLPNYIVEARETISEEELYVSMIPIYSSISEDATANTDYGFKGNWEITALELDYPENFANITKHEIGEPTTNIEGDIDYPVVIYFSEFGPTQRTVFRPFLRVHSENDSGWLIPGYPAYIWNPESVD
jgi:hypothetical protein